jgi:catechol 2,3-dioxygenase-like lactoylglutathione lyase family enzyme
MWRLRAGIMIAARASPSARAAWRQVRLRCSFANDLDDVTGIAPKGADIADTKLEVVVLAVTDVDRAKAFYQGLGWRLDADLAADEHYRVVQFTPPNSPASIQFGTGITTMSPGSVHDLMLIVEDVQAARADLISHGASVSEVWHGAGLNVERRVPGPDPERHSYRSFATFADPDGNSFLLQEVTERLPGRVWPTDVAALADLLHETADHHGAFEAVAPPHDWWDWYAVYLDARQHGSTPDAASAAAGRYMAEVKHIVV